MMVHALPSELQPVAVMVGAMSRAPDET